MRRILSIAVLIGCIWFIANQAAKQTPPEQVENSPVVSVHPKNKWLDLQPFPTAKTEGDCTNDFVVFHNGTFTAQHDGYNQPFTVQREEGDVVKGDSRKIYYYWPYKDGKKKFKMQLTAAEMKCLPVKQ